jgi:hypothetical protein
VIHRAVESPISAAPPYDRQAYGLRVGIFGSTYGSSQPSVLAAALADAARRLSVPGRLLVVGGQPEGERLRKKFGSRIAVELVGYVPEEEAVTYLQRCFLLYLNYPFGPRSRVMRRTSFPTKLSSYGMAARPLLVHAPDDSSIGALDADFPDYAKRWATNTPADGSEMLVELWNKPGIDDSAHADADEVRRRYFDPDRNRRILFDALNALIADVHPG